MTTMGVGRIVTPERSLISVPRARAWPVHAPSRRLFLQAGGAALAGGVLYGANGCSGGGDAWTYLLEAVAVAAADIVGVYLFGVPVGTLVVGFAENINSAASSNAKPGHVTIEHPVASSAQGDMGTLVRYDMPTQSDQAGKSTVDTQGINWVHSNNPTEDDIAYIKLITSDGTQVRPQNMGLTGYLVTPWHPGEDLFMTGIPDRDYRKIWFQTTGGKQGELMIQR